MVQIPAEPLPPESGEPLSETQPLSDDNPNTENVSETVEDFGYTTAAATAETTDPSSPINDDLQTNGDPDSDTTDDHAALPIDWNSPQSQNKQRFRMIIGGAAGSLALFAVIIGYFVFGGSDERQTVQLPDEINPQPQPPDEIPEATAEPTQTTDPIVPKPEGTDPPDKPNLPSQPQPENVDPSTTPPTTPEPVKPVNPVAPPGFQAPETTPSDTANLDTILVDLAPFLGNSSNPVLTGPERPRVPTPAVTSNPAATVNIEAGLSFTVPNLVISEEITLFRFFYLATTLGNFPITIDIESFELSDSSLFAPVTVNAQNKSISEILTDVLEPHGLTIVPEGGHVIVVHQRHLKPDVMTTTIDLQDLELKDKSAVNLADLINQILADVDKPIAQVARGDLGAVIEGAITIEGNQRRQDQVRRFIRRLIQAEAKLVIDGLAHEFDVWQPYQQKSSLNFARQTPLVTVLAYLNNESGLHFQINWDQLWKVGWTPGSQVKLVTDNEPLVDSLENLLTNHGLSFIARADNILEITSASHALQTNVVSCYDLSQMDAGRHASLLKTLSALKQAADEEATDELKVDIRFIEQGPGGHLILAAPAPIHRQITGVITAADKPPADPNQDAEQ